MVSVNVRFLAKLLFGVVVVAAVVAGVHFVQQKRIPNALRAQIDRATDDGNADLAIRHLRQYLEFRPDDLDARSDLATRLKARGSTAELAFLYDRILRGNPNLPAIRRDALALAVEQHRYSDAVEHAKKLLEFEPNDGPAWRLLADSLAALHRNEETVAAYEKAIAHAGDDPAAFAEYVTWLWTEVNRTADAMVVADRFVAAFPKRPEPLVLRSRMRMSENELARPDVIADLEKARSLAPDHADALQLAADWRQRAGETSAARDLLVEGIARHPSDVRFPRRLAWLDLNRGNPITALATLEMGLTRVKAGYDELLIPLGDLLIQLGETKRAASIATQLEAKATTTAKVQAKYLRARLAMKSADWPTAIATLTELRTDTVTLPGLTQQANLLLAIAHRQTANVAAERECLMLVLNRDPKHVAARVALAQSFLVAGDSTAAIREFDEAAKSPYASGGTAAMPIRLRAIRLQQSSTARPQDWIELERACTALAQRFPKEPGEAARLFADLFLRKGEPSRAVALLRQEIGRRPNDARVWAQLVEATAVGFGSAAALAVCEEGLAIAGDGPDLRIAKANVAALDPLGSIPFDSFDLQIEAWTDADQARLLGGLVDAAARCHSPAMVRLTQRLAARRAGDPLGWVTLFEQAVLNNDAKAMALARSQLVRIEGPSGPNVVYVNQIDKPDLATLVKTFGEMPTRADVCILRSRCEFDVESKVKWLERGLTLEPTNYAVVRELFSTCARENRPAMLESLVVRLNADPRWNGDSLRRVVLLAVAANPACDATATWDRLTTNDPAGFAFRAEVEVLRRNGELAQGWLRRACDSPIATPDDFTRIVKRFPDEASKMMAVAAKRFPPRAIAALDVSLSAVGEPSKLPATLDRLQAVVAFESLRGRPREAIAALTNAKLNSSYNPTDQTWIARTLAILRAAHGEPTERTQAAVELLNLPIDGMTADERRTIAAAMVGLHRSLDGEMRNAVLVRAADLLATATAPRDRYLVFQILRTIGDDASRNRARQLLNELLKTDPTNREFLVAGLEELLEAKALPQGEPFAAALRQHAGDAFPAIAVVARYECAIGRFDRVLPLVEAWCRAGESRSAVLTARTMKSADLLDELARRPDVRTSQSAKAITNAAIDKYAALLPARLEAAPAAAGLLATNGRPDDAITFVNRFAAVLPNRTKAAAGVAILRSGTFTPAGVATARAWLDAALADDLFGNAVQLNLGEFFALTGDRDKADATFRGVLERDPQNTIALNNLAWVLATKPEQSHTALTLVDRAAKDRGLTPELLDTRARIHIAAKKGELAERDLLAALNQQKSPLRYFHLALAKQSANKPDEAKSLFRQALDAGLEPGMVHPDDRATYRSWLANGVN
jgi:tetratricopeptide (TPR) repeat protein